MDKLLAQTAESGAAENILSLRGFGVAFGERVILSEVDLDIPARGIMVLMGPCGTGKSTLLRTLAGFNDANPSLRRWGKAEYLGAPLGGAQHPALVGQDARLMMSSVLENVVHLLPERPLLTRSAQRELAVRLLTHAGIPELAASLDDLVVQLPAALQRHLGVLRQAAAGPRLLCIDEPTTGLTEAESQRLMNYLRAEARHRALLVVLHNQLQARYLGGMAVLLAGGAVQEIQPVTGFLENPISPPARDFVRTGTCSLPRPDAKSEELDESVPPPKPLPEGAHRYVSDSFGPRGFLWLKKGSLAGTPLPGAFYDADYDMKALQRVGVTVLVTLTEKPLDRAMLDRFDMKNIWEPIPDMHAPSISQAKTLCRLIGELVRQNEVVAVHCYAGLGRTGTVLAACLIWEGRNAMNALETVRSIEPRWVQSETQVAFLEEFSRAVAAETATASAV